MHASSVYVHVHMRMCVCVVRGRGKGTCLCPWSLSCGSFSPRPLSLLLFNYPSVTGYVEGILVNVLAEKSKPNAVGAKNIHDREWSIGSLMQGSLRGWKLLFYPWKPCTPASKHVGIEGWERVALQGRMEGCAPPTLTLFHPCTWSLPQAEPEELHRDDSGTGLVCP